jgi:hypothetical protein
MADDGHRSVHYRKKALPERLWRPIFERQRDRLYQRFVAAFPPVRERRIVNIGVNGSYDRPDRHFLESRYPYKDRITACGLEEPDLFRACYPSTRYVQLVRGEPLPFADGEFDLVFSNAVVEHVGDRAAQGRFLAEVLRIARSAFVTTPNRWYPVELHTMVPLVHYLPSAMYRDVYRRLGFAFFADERNLNLLDRSALAALIPPGVRAEIAEHRFLGFAANLLVIVRPAA